MLSTDQIEELIESDSNYSKAYFVWQIDPKHTDLEEFFNEHVLPDLDDRILALCLEEGMYYSEAELALEKDYWKVLTDDEAYRLALDYAEDSCDTALSEMPEYLRAYFDDERYIDDLMEYRGELITSSDGCEYTQTVNGTTYYLYKQ
jgi:hypothetical protein